MTPERIKLINCDKKILESLAQGYEALSKCLNIRVMDKWTEFGDQIFALSLQEVKVILAHTLPEENFSVKVLKKWDFKFVKELYDSEDGTIWQWEKVK